VVNDTTYALFGSQGTVRLVFTNGSSKLIRGERLLPDLVGGAFVTQDSVLIIDSNGFASVVDISAGTEVPFESSIEGRATGCYVSRLGYLLVFTENGIAVRRPDFSHAIIDGVDVDAYHELPDGSFCFSTSSGDILTLSIDFSRIDTLGKSDDRIQGITNSTDRIWYVTSKSIVFAMKADGYRNWTAITLSSVTGRSITCAKDTIIVGSERSGHVTQYLSTDGTDWIGGTVSTYDYSGYRMLRGNGGIIVYGMRGFYRVASDSPLYSPEKQPFVGLGSGPNAVVGYRTTSMCRISETEWVATTMSPNAVVRSIDSGRTWQLLDIQFQVGIHEYVRIRRVKDYYYLLVDSVRSILVNGSWMTVKQWCMKRSQNLTSWMSVTADSVFHGGVDFAVDSTGAVFVFGNWGLWKIDSSFNAFSSVNVDSPGSISSMCINSAGTIAAAGNVLMISKDGGQSWLYYPFPEMNFIKKLCWLYDDGTVVIVSGDFAGGTYNLISASAGYPYVNWNRMTIVNGDGRLMEPYAIEHKSDLGTFVVTQSAYVVSSSDRGSSWTVEQPLGRSIVILSSVHLGESGIVRIGGEGSVLLERSFSVSSLRESSHENARYDCSAVWLGNQLRLNVDYSDKSVLIVDVRGAVVFTGVAIRGREFAIVSCEHSLSPGVYFVRSSDFNLPVCPLMIGGR